MYSTTVSCVSTATAHSDSCQIVDDLHSSPSEPSRQPCLHTLDDAILPETCRAYLNRHLAKPDSTPRQGIETECGICKEKNDDFGKTIQPWSQKQFDNKCYPLQVTKNRLKKRMVRIQKVSNEFQKSVCPWYIANKPETVMPTYRKNYCYPKMAVQLELGFNDHRKIIECAGHGMNMFIVNLQYGTRKKQLRTFNSINRAIRKIERNAYLDCEIGIVAEISDPKLRTGLLNHNAKDIYLDRDSRIVLTADRRFSHKGSHEVVYVNFTNFVESLHPKNQITIGCDIVVEIEERLVKTVICRVVKPGLLKPQQEIFVPEMQSQVGKYISVEEEEDINFILENSNCDFIVCPCAHNISVCQYIRWFMATHQKRMFIIGKMKPDLYADESVIEKIVQEFSGIWIDSSEMEEPSQLQKVIVSKCIMEGKPLMRSANFLNCEHIKLPKNRGICRNLLVYPDCLVLPSCLPNNLRPMDVRPILRENYPEMNEETMEYCCTFIPRENSAAHMLIRQVALNVIFEKVSCVIMVNNTGRSATLLSQNRITVPIIATVRDETIARRMLIWKNVVPLLYFESLLCDWHEELDDRVAFSLDYAKRYGYIAESDVFIICFDSQRGLKLADSFRLGTLNCGEYIE